DGPTSPIPADCFRSAAPTGAPRQIRKQTPATEIMILTLSDGDEIAHLTLAADGDSSHQGAGNGGTEPQGIGKHGLPDASDGACATHIEAERDEALGDPASLTAREREVVCLIAEGKSNKHIARLLDISTKTVESHRSAAMRKMNVHSTAQLVRCAIRCRLIAP